MKTKPKPSAGLDHETNEKREVPMFLRKSNLAKIQIPETAVGMKSNPCGTGKKR